MNNRIRNGKAGQMLFAYLFCLVLLFSELNSFNQDFYRKQALPSGENGKEDVSNKKRAVFTKDFIGIAGEENSGETISPSSARINFGTLPVKYLISGIVLLFIPLVLWAVIAVLLQDSYIGRLFLIRFIHDSDGAKGMAERLLPVC